MWMILHHNIRFIVILLAIHCRQNFSSELDPNIFDKQVLNDDRVWLVEFYSSMCGSCQEFAPKWEKLASSIKYISTGKVSIDNETGLNLAKSLGVLDQGLPNIQLFKDRGKENGLSVLAGDDLTLKQIQQNIKQIVSGVPRRDDGFYLKTP